MASTFPQPFCPLACSEMLFFFPIPSHPHMCRSGTSGLAYVYTHIGERCNVGTRTKTRYSYPRIKFKAFLMRFWSLEAAEEASRCRQCSTFYLFTVKPKATGGLSHQRVAVVTEKIRLELFVNLTLSYTWCLRTQMYTRAACLPAETHTSWCCVVAGGLWAQRWEDLRGGFLDNRFRGPGLWIRSVQSSQPFGVFGTMMGRNLRLRMQEHFKSHYMAWMAIKKGDARRFSGC